MSKAVQVSAAPQFPLPFSHAVQAGDFIYVSGQVGVDPSTAQITGDTIEEQTRQTIRNIETILAHFGLTLDHVVKVNAYVSRKEDLPGYNKTYAEVFGKPYPARTTAPVDLMPYLVEIDAVAYTGSKREAGE